MGPQLRRKCGAAAGFGCARTLPHRLRHLSRGLCQMRCALDPPVMGCTLCRWHRARDHKLKARPCCWRPPQAAQLRRIGVECKAEPAAEAVAADEFPRGAACRWLDVWACGAPASGSAALGVQLWPAAVAVAIKPPLPSAARSHALPLTIWEVFQSAIGRGCAQTVLKIESA